MVLTIVNETQTIVSDRVLSAPGANHLTGDVQRVADVTLAQRDRMYRLLSRYFDHVSRPQFERDLAEKEWVILLTDTGRGRIRGFSTLMRLQTTIDDQPVVAFFSGDTIIQREYWGETALPRLWGRYVFALADTIRPDKVYWFLICSGYKTYRFLSVFFREFYPTYRHPMPPPIKRTIDSLAHLKFPAEYDPKRGIIRPVQAAPLRPNVAEITERRLKDPHIAFFVAANPGHVHGDELACLAEITPANLTRAGRRMLGG